MKFLFIVSISFFTLSLSAQELPKGAEFSQLFWGCDKGITLQLPDSVLTDEGWYSHEYQHTGFGLRKFFITMGGTFISLSRDSVVLGIQTRETSFGEVTFTVTSPRFSVVGADWNSTNVYDGGLFYEASTKKSSRDGFTLQISERGIVVNTSRKGKTISAETYELPKSFRELGLTIELIRQKHKVEILLH